MRRLPLLAILVATTVACALPGISPRQVAHAVGTDPLFFRGEPEDNFWDLTPTFCTDGFIITAAQQFQSGNFLSHDTSPFSVQLTAATPSVQALGPIASSDGSNDVTNTPVVHSATFMWSAPQAVGAPLSITTERWDHGATGSPTAVLDDAAASGPGEPDGSDFDDVKILMYSSSDSDQFVSWPVAPSIEAEEIGSPGTVVTDCSVLPSTIATLTPVPNATGWNNTSVLVTLNAVPATAGVFPIAATYYAVDNRTCAPTALSSCSTYTGRFKVGGQGRHTLYFFSVDTGGNAGPRQQVPVRIDKTAPTIAISAPISTVYTLNQPVTANYACSDALSGVATCAGPVASGSHIDTASVGAKTFTVSATDRAGNTFSRSVNYSVGISSNVQGGWSLVTPPLTPAGSLTASSVLAQVLNTSGGALAALYGLATNGWAPSLIQRAGGAQTGQDFPLQPGQGYLLYSASGGRYIEAGTIPAAMPVWSLRAGWNLVGLPMGLTGTLRASSVLSGVLGNTGTLAAIFGLSASRWFPSLIEVAGSPPSGIDFPLQPGTGYLLYTDHNVNYQPGQPAPHTMPPPTGVGSQHGEPGAPLPPLPPLP